VRLWLINIKTNIDILKTSEYLLIIKLIVCIRAAEK